MIKNHKRTPQVEEYGPVPAGKHRKSMENGSSIPVNGSGVRIYRVPPGIDKNLSKPAAGYGHRNTASVRFPLISGVFLREPAIFPGLSCRFLQYPVTGTI